MDCPAVRLGAAGQPHQLRFDTPTVARAFWSVARGDTVYVGVAEYAVEDSIKRQYSAVTPIVPIAGVASIDRTKTYRQRNEPDTGDGSANWVPFPPTCVTSRARFTGLNMRLLMQLGNMRLQGPANASAIDPSFHRDCSFDCYSVSMIKDGRAN
ncbi:MAG: hypothetical protein CMF24_00740 [Ilumatobacter sp.]|nr:hypothetical protein [Ilumatobacter sp.]